MESFSFENLIEEIESDFKNCIDAQSLDNFKLKYFGKMGKIPFLFKELPKLSESNKRDFSLKLNNIKDTYLLEISSLKEKFDIAKLEASLTKEKLDLTLPAREYKQGSIHVISKVIKELSDIFRNMGFIDSDGPTIEDEFHNFQALNFPDNHPSKNMHDTFYLHGGKLLRTHTSTVQIRWMQNNPTPPYKITSYGKVYRCDYDATHTPMFHQFEALVIDRNLNMADLKTCIEYFLKEFFERADFRIRMRPSFFPFTEPSMEVDVEFPEKKGEWLEILGSGMVHPNVLRNVNLDPDVYKGFAMGVGIERMAMLKYGLNDLREFFVGDERWSKIHNFSLIDFLGK